jgi:hypothetical protein
VVADKLDGPTPMRVRIAATRESADLGGAEGGVLAAKQRCAAKAAIDFAFHKQNQCC